MVILARSHPFEKIFEIKYFRQEHSRQEDESHLTTSGAVNNVHKSFIKNENHNYTRQKRIWSATHHVGKWTQKRRQHKKLHGELPYGCNWQQKPIRGVWRRRKWPKWGTWTAHKFLRRIYFKRPERSNSQPLQQEHKAVQFLQLHSDIFVNMALNYRKQVWLFLLRCLTVKFQTESFIYIFHQNLEWQ